MQELDQTQELIQMLKERLNEKDETIATLQATIETLQITIANLTETLDEFKRKFFGISSEKSKKKQAGCNQTQKELRHSDKYCFVDNSAVR